MGTSPRIHNFKRFPMASLPTKRGGCLNRCRCVAPSKRWRLGTVALPRPWEGGCPNRCRCGCPNRCRCVAPPKRRRLGTVALPKPGRAVVPTAADAWHHPNDGDWGQSPSRGQGGRLSQPLPMHGTAQTTATGDSRPPEAREGGCPNRCRSMAPPKRRRLGTVALPKPGRAVVPTAADAWHRPNGGDWGQSPSRSQGGRLSQPLPMRLSQPLPMCGTVQTAASGDSRPPKVREGGCPNRCRCGYLNRCRCVAPSKRRRLGTVALPKPGRAVVPTAADAWHHPNDGDWGQSPSQSPERRLSHFFLMAT